MLAALPADAAGVALALASHSRHPLSRALAEALSLAGHRAAELAEVREVPGEGVRALWQSTRVSLRRPNGEDAGQAVAGQGAGTMSSVLDIAGRPAWLIPFADRLRPDAQEALARLHRLGVEPSILSGDNAGAVADFARLTGLAAQAS